MAKQTPTNWAPIVGRWSFEGDRVTYVGPDPQFPRPFGICLTDLQLTEGSVACRTQFTVAPLPEESEGRILLGYRSLSEPYIMAGIGGWGHAYSVGDYLPNFGWRALELAGSAQNLVPNQWYSQSVDLSGQRLQVFVNNVRVLRHVLDKRIGTGQVGLFAFGKGAVEFDGFAVESRPGKVFVVMQFSEPYRQLYEEVIRPVAAKFCLTAYHVGEVFGPGLILNDIQRGIIEAEIVIAEITPINQNVFYELGYSHALNKPTILLAERGKQLPFDVSGYRVLMYDNTIAGKRQVEEALLKHLDAILHE